MGADFKRSKNAFVKSTYLWIGIVPVAAKALEKVGETVTLKSFDPDLVLTLALPFSWQMFFWGALCFVLSNLMYAWQCPAIFKLFENIDEYRKEGFSVNSVIKMYKGIGGNFRPIDEFIEARGNLKEGEKGPVANRYRRGITPEMTKGMEAEMFIYTRVQLSKRKWFPRLWCTWLVRLGFVLFGIVLAQNVWFVGSVTLKAIF